MKEIKCPNCGEVFKVDESAYAQILSQIRNNEFNEELHKREKELKLQQESSFAQEKTKMQLEYENQLNQLKQELSKQESAKELAVIKANSDAEVEINKLKETINNLKSDLSLKDKEKEIELEKLNSTKDRQLQELKLELANDKQNSDNILQNTKDDYERQLKLKDEMIAQYKDFKARQSTKMIGESLEQHCENEFNKWRATAFRSAEFGKDNDDKSGSKGDYIFRDFDDEGNEYLSIMFEMKNEADDTQKKHKNKDFFDKLDKDRKEKKCEYAVLVSLLEADNDLYNDGIVDVSTNERPKMYVIRPQLFIPLITILKNAASNSISYRKQLIEYKNQNLDITNFENEINEFKNSFSKTVSNAGKQYDEAIKRIDEAIKQMEKVKEALRISSTHLIAADNKAQNDLTIKKLTKDNPTVKKMFDDLDKK